VEKFGRGLHPGVDQQEKEREINKRPKNNQTQIP